MQRFSWCTGSMFHYVEELLAPTLVRCVMAAWYWSRSLAFFTTSFRRGANITQPIDFTITCKCNNRQSVHVTRNLKSDPVGIWIWQSLPFHLHASLHKLMHAKEVQFHLHNCWLKCDLTDHTHTRKRSGRRCRFHLLKIFLKKALDYIDNLWKKILIKIICCRAAIPWLSLHLFVFLRAASFSSMSSAMVLKVKIQGFLIL